MTFPAVVLAVLAVSHLGQTPPRQTGSAFELLANNVDRAVIDRTGLTGVYDLELAWTPDDGVADVVTRDAPGLFTAIVEQLALKLEPAVGPVDVLVIDGIERPTED